ncbi:uncharacterized protein N0V89_000514 [Didymosphaeria variabile]|uniref:Uncharacterized protein n=1 Tax=Didymosphaeria variabile TaxID=1932322 RepID=A0A9W8XWT1_9PLEO|nr:uncharacterized protein N0V89_000514 [Didymosphaeria variabile]KAJ4359955.1 hypothetical protein N0V89_000514 [Didymosphaeria variabile]
MSDSPSPTSFSSASPPSIPISRYEKFKAKLAPFRDAAIGYVEGLQVVSEKVIFGITLHDMDDLKLDDLYWETKNNTAFHGILHKKKKSSDEKTWNEDLDEDLRLAAFFTSNCSKAVYCFLPQVRKILDDDPDFDKASWSRQYIDPKLILFDVDQDGNQRKSPLSFLAHDFITITCKDSQRFVLDVAGDQFGIEEWFYTKKGYWKLLLEGRFPEITTEAAKAHHVEEEDNRNPALRIAVEEALEEVKADWARYNLTWNDIYLLPEEKQDELRQGIVTKVRAKVVAALRG